MLNLEPRICVRCRRLFIPRRIKQTICSVQCRLTRIVRLERSCADCGQSFAPRSLTAKCCSTACYDRWWHRENKVYYNAKRKEWRDRNPGHDSLMATCSKRGITKSEWLRLFEQQGQRCAICKLHASEVKSSRKWRTLYLDHDHATDKPRGLICPKCNGMLGFADDSVERLAAGIEYLRAWM